MFALMEGDHCSLKKNKSFCCTVSVRAVDNQIKSQVVNRMVDRLNYFFSPPGTNHESGKVQQPDCSPRSDLQVVKGCSLGIMF